MPLPYFFLRSLSQGTHNLEEPTSKHIVQVLRMGLGEKLLLTDGLGNRGEATIADVNRKRCSVVVEKVAYEEVPVPTVTIAISTLKNSSRFEWFLEKAAEIGVAEIIPLQCRRTEGEKFRQERLNGILISAMLQSQQCRMPRLSAPVLFEKLLERTTNEHRFIAHCLPEQKEQLSAIGGRSSSLILIGPEGDFTAEEISSALSKGFKPVALGNTRLRTETAGIVAATLLCNG